jgi:hypothetical protein
VVDAAEDKIATFRISYRQANIHAIHGHSCGLVSFAVRPFMLLDTKRIVHRHAVAASAALSIGSHNYNISELARDLAQSSDARSVDSVVIGYQNPHEDI